MLCAYSLQNTTVTTTVTTPVLATVPTTVPTSVTTTVPTAPHVPPRPPNSDVVRAYGTEAENSDANARVPLLRVRHLVRGIIDHLSSPQYLPLFCATHAYRA